MKSNLKKVSILSISFLKKKKNFTNISFSKTFDYFENFVCLVNLCWINEFIKCILIENQKMHSHWESKLKYGLKRLFIYIIYFRRKVFYCNLYLKHEVWNKLYCHFWSGLKDIRVQFLPGYRDTGISEFRSYQDIGIQEYQGSGLTRI